MTREPCWLRGGRFIDDFPAIHAMMGSRPWFDMLRCGKSMAMRSTCSDARKIGPELVTLAEPAAQQCSMIDFELPVRNAINIDLPPMVHCAKPPMSPAWIESAFFHGGFGGAGPVGSGAIAQLWRYYRRAVR